VYASLQPPLRRRSGGYEVEAGDGTFTTEPTAFTFAEAAPVALPDVLRQRVVEPLTTDETANP
jgi:hypothetical protein